MPVPGVAELMGREIMVRLMRCLAAASAVAALLAAATTAPALADSQRHRDPHGDVEGISSFGSRDRAGRVDRDRMDIVRSANRLDPDALLLRIEVVDLTRRGWITQWQIKTHRRTYLLTADHRRKQPALDLHVLRLPRESARTSGRCPRLGFDTRGDVMMASVPIACLDHARAVRVGGITGVVTESRIFSDDARRDGYDAEAGLRYGPWLARG